MKKFLVLFLVCATVALAVSPGEAGVRCGKKWEKGPEFKISPCRIFMPWGFKCRNCDDIDMDGINDCDDQCLGTPANAVVDEFGCPSDSDNDGVFDGIDQCPATPKGAEVDSRGCPSDSDGDGVLDGIDKCAKTPEGAKVDEKGCPIDSDNDGVFDGIDECPDTSADLAVNKKGCPVATSEFETQFIDAGMISTSKINFESNKDEFLAGSHEVIEEIGAVLVNWPAAKVEIGGHSDSQGAAEYNQTLSEKRAAAVRAYLVSKYPKMDMANLTAKGYGETTPVATNDTKEGRAQNRRVEFSVLNKEELKKEIERKGYEKR
ncbi:MAG: OmpA family protein [Candidatus Krumholzibacteria bacterium]|nr:OmpA family protein [Candidatus Krumholzibacteria bacterium]